MTFTNIANNKFWIFQHKFIFLTYIAGNCKQRRLLFGKIVLKPNSFNFADLKASNEDLEEENHEKDESQENRKYSEPSEETG